MSSPVPSEYADTLESIKRLVHQARYVAQRRVNTELLRLYWQIGATIIERQKTAPWGSKVLSRLSADLRTEFPGVKGFSPANLKYMRRFAEAWPDPDAIGQRPVGQLPWGHVIELLDKLEDAELREWYSAKDVAHGWSRPVLAHQIKTSLHTREGGGPIELPARSRTHRLRACSTAHQGSVHTRVPRHRRRYRGAQARGSARRAHHRHSA